MKKQSSSIKQKINDLLAKIALFFSSLWALIFPAKQHQHEAPLPPQVVTISPTPAVITPAVTVVTTVPRPLSFPAPLPANTPSVISGPPILFYDRNQPYYEFTNFASSPITVNKLEYPTAEHYFQAEKFRHSPDPSIVQMAETVRLAPTPREVFNLANGTNGQYKNYIRKDWQNHICDQVMLETQLYKYSQNPNLLQALLDTQNCLLIEDAGPRDKFWGNGQKGSLTDQYGENKLGKILMAVRSVFAKALAENNTEQTATVVFKNGYEHIDPTIDLKEYGFNLEAFKKARANGVGAVRRL